MAPIALPTRPPAFFVQAYEVACIVRRHSGRACSSPWMGKPGERHWDRPAPLESRQGLFPRLDDIWGNYRASGPGGVTLGGAGILSCSTRVD